MNFKEFDELTDQFVKRMEVCLGAKGHDYSIDGDRLSNFAAIGQMAGVDTMTVWKILFLKHVVGALSYIKNGTSMTNEDLPHRLMDMANYCVLAQGLYEEAQGLGGHVADVVGTRAAVAESIDRIEKRKVRAASKYDDLAEASDRVNAARVADAVGKTSDEIVFDRLCRIARAEERGTPGIEVISGDDGSVTIKRTARTSTSLPMPASVNLPEALAGGSES